MAWPPCEAWSAARHLKLESHGLLGPRPLGTQDQLWRLTCLRKSEASNISVGNSLLRATIRMFLAAHLNPTVAIIMEHPKRPSRLPPSASSWIVPELEYIGNLPAAQAVHIDQCMFGAVSKKPTTLLCLQVSRLHHLLSMPHICDRRHQHQVVLRGLDSNGLLRTAPAKQYPKGLRQILAKLPYGQFTDSCAIRPLPPLLS